MDVPLVSEYKLGFAWRRGLQTFFGGARFALGYSVPFSLRVVQLILFLMPALLGALFTILVESEALDMNAAMALDGVLFCVYSVIVQVLRTLSENSRRTAVVNFQYSHDGLYSGTLSSKIRRAVKVEMSTDEPDQLPTVARGGHLPCCSAEALRFLVPNGRPPGAVLLHSGIAGVLHALALQFLMPSAQAKSWGSNSIGMLLCVLGWLSSCCGLYGVTITCPPEPAVFQPVEGTYLGPLHRPLYLAFILLGHLACQHIKCWRFSWRNEVDAYLSLIWVALPGLWMASLLPPPVALLHWSAEQLDRWALGGSPKHDLIWQLIWLCAGCLEVAALFYVTDWTASVHLALVVGFLLSQDLASLYTWSITRARSLSMRRNSDSNSQRDTSKSSTSRAASSRNCPGPCRAAFALGALAFTIAAAHLSIQASAEEASWLTPILGAICMGLFAAIWAIQQLQGVYLCGVVRNPLFPPSASNLESFKRRKTSLRYFKYARLVLYQLVTPALVSAYLGIRGQNRDPDHSKLLSCVALARALRNVWQNTDCALLEMSVAEVLQRCGFRLKGIVDLPVLLLIVGFAVDRFWQALNGLYLVLVLTVATLTQPKQRLKYGWLLAVGNLGASPVLLGLVSLAALLSAPLLPLLTLPFFLVGFPRPTKFWHGKVSPWKSSGEDCIYYKQAIPQFLNGLGTALASGTLGFVQSGDFLLARFQDRLVWIHVLERGYLYCRINVKGLELQETSCHALEATQPFQFFCCGSPDLVFQRGFQDASACNEVDVMFESAFLKDEKNQHLLNRNVGSVLRPRDVILAKVYSDARSALTGVMDSPDLVEHLHNYFPKVLLWVLLERGLKLVLEHQANTDLQRTTFLRQSPSMGSTIKSILHDLSREVSGKGASHDRWAEPVNSASGRSMSSLWSDDEEDDVLGDLPSGRIRAVPEPMIVDSTAGPPVSVLSTHEGREKDETEEDQDVDDEDDDEEENEKDELPEEARMEVKTARPSSGDGFKSVQLSDLSEVPILSFPDFPVRSANTLEPPSSWKLAYEANRNRCSSGRSFSQDWLTRVLKFLSMTSMEVKNVLEEAEDSVFKDYSDIVRLCCSAVQCNKAGAPAKGSSAYTIHLIYSGSLPQTYVMTDVLKCQDLAALLTKAFRYSLKLALDEVLLQGVVDEADLLRQLSEYDQHWYIGDESEQEWAKAVSKETEYLFAVTYNPVQSVYRSHLLTLQESPVYVGHLNSAAVHGIWSSLALELLYLTNDDDERYSIQAHPTLLRNLTIQAADPPLGYPVYSSGAVTLQTLL